MIEKLNLEQRKNCKVEAMTKTDRFEAIKGFKSYDKNF